VSHLNNIILRITALWAFSEAFLGGILHAFHIPFAGLILSSFAVLCMVALNLQGYYKGLILKATILVIIIKALISPHTPVSAYFAVLLQGAFGELLFFTGVPFFFSCIFLGIAALMQSAFQKLIILTLIFGVDFWKALDEFLNTITKLMGAATVSYSFYLVIIYLVVHFVAGLFIGVFSYRLPGLLLGAKEEFKDIQFSIPDSLVIIPLTKNSKTKFGKPIYWLLFLLLSFALYQAYSEKSLLILAQSKAVKLIIRSTLFLLFWYFFAAPLLLLLFQKWLAKQQGKFSQEIDSILKLLPEMKFITEKCWIQTKDFRGLRRVNKFIRFTFFMLLSNKNADISS
jgi:hypothetical protein